MAHWREWMDSKSDYVKAWDLKGKDVTLRIEKATQGVLEDKVKRKKDRMPVIHFAANPGKKPCKPLGLNVTNCKTIAGMYGNDPTKWAGRLITLFPTTTSSSDGIVDCIRIRPMVPRDSDGAPDADPSTDDSLLSDPSDGDEP